MDIDSLATRAMMTPNGSNRLARLHQSEKNEKRGAIDSCFAFDAARKCGGALARAARLDGFTRLI